MPDMPSVVSAIDGTSHEMQIPSNEPQQKHTFSKPIIFILSLVTRLGWLATEFYDYTLFISLSLLNLKL
jgi:hypothetical protein